MTEDTQCKAILRHLRERSINPLRALEKFGRSRLAARIWDLKRDGHQIVRCWHKTPSGKRVARYLLVKGRAA